MSKRKRSRSSHGRFISNEFLIYEVKELNTNLNNKDVVSTQTSNEDSTEVLEQVLDKIFENISAETLDESPDEINHDGNSIMDDRSLENSALETNEFSNERKTTTPTIDLVWPPIVNSDQKLSILKMVVGIDSKDIQSLLDEMRQTTRVIRNPVAYFKSLLGEYENGSYIPSGALVEKEKREAKEKGEDRMEFLMQESIRRGNEFLAKHSNGLPS